MASGDVRLGEAPDAPLRGECSSATAVSASHTPVVRSHDHSEAAANVSSQRFFRDCANVIAARSSSDERVSTIDGQHHRAIRPDVWLYPEPAAIG